MEVIKIRRNQNSVTFMTIFNKIYILNYILSRSGFVDSIALELSRFYGKFLVWMFLSDSNSVVNSYSWTYFA